MWEEEDNVGTCNTEQQRTRHTNTHTETQTHTKNITTHIHNVDGYNITNMRTNKHTTKTHQKQNKKKHNTQTTNKTKQNDHDAGTQFLT